MSLSAATGMLTLLVLSGSAGAADQPDGAARVRVSTRSEGKIVGTLLRRDSSGVTLAVDGTPKTFALEDLTGLEVSRGRRAQKTKWALIGAVPWVVVATIVLAEGGSDESGIVSAPSALLLGGGVAAGLVIGSHRKADVWAPIGIPATANPRRGHELSLTLAVSF